MASLMNKVNHRLHQAFRPSTSAAYDNMLRVFVAFLIFAQFSFPHVTTNQVLVFMEFLVFNNVSNLFINNYLSAIKAKFIIHDLDTACFHNPRIKYFARSLALSAPSKITLKAVIDIPLLKRIVSRCNTMYLGMIYKAAFLLSYFSATC